MAIHTKIEYADSSCNAVMGCTGCELYPDHCYANRLCSRFEGHKGWPSDFCKAEVFDHRIPRALTWPDLTGTEREDKPWLNGYPRIVFLNDLGDGFCPDVDPDEWLTPHLDAMSESPHIWLLLTKWPERMARYFAERRPPHNFWPGTTVTKPTSLWRLDDLMAIDSPFLWLSAEPLLAPLDRLQDYFRGFGRFQISTALSWVVAGGESGPNARPTHPDWARKVRDDCVEAGVPFLFKQGSENNWQSFRDFRSFPKDLQIREMPNA